MALDGRLRPRLAGAAAVVAMLLASSCGDAEDRSAPESRARRSEPSRPQLVDVAEEAGVDFTHGAFRWETNGDPVAMMGGGLCWLDMDGDDDLDLYTVNSYAQLEARQWDADGRRPVNRLFRNDGGDFTDVSEGSGADLDVLGNGCVAADLDQDGATDLFVTTARQNAMLWGNGDGTFTEGAADAGLDGYGWHSGAVVGDLNGDGLPDLFVAGYVDLNVPDVDADQGFPNTYGGIRDLVYINEGEGPDGRVTFREVGEQLGIDADSEYGLGALLTDVDGDNDLDLYVANDTNPNRLYLNQPDRSGADPGFALVEAGAQAAVADPNSGMGVAGADYDGDGRGDLFVTNFGEQTHALFTNRTAGAEAAFTDGLAAIGLETLGVGRTGWGTGFFDIDLDSDLDLLVAHGDVPLLDLADDAQPLAAYANQAGGAAGPVFEEMGEAIGLPDIGPLNARGLAAADYDNDGDVDVAISSIGAPLVLLENRGAAGNWLEVSTEEFAPGAVVRVQLEDGRELRRELHAGSSYLSSEDPRAHFGLGPATTVVAVTVDWPGGGSTVIENVEANQIVTIDETST